MSKKSGELERGVGVEMGMEVRRMVRKEVKENGPGEYMGRELGMVNVKGTCAWLHARGRVTLGTSMGMSMTRVWWLERRHGIKGLRWLSYGGYGFLYY